MKRVLTVSQMRQSDEQTILSGVPAEKLMLNAASGIIQQCSVISPVAVVCGKGNNGGDGFAIALLLKRKGVSVHVFTLYDDISKAAAYYRDLCISEGTNISRFSDDSDLSCYETIFDCIFGIGFHSEADGIEAKAISEINCSGAFVISADINSGLSGDSGMGGSHVVSDITIAVQSYKPGHFLNMAKDSMKEKKCCDIGIKEAEGSVFLIEETDVKSIFRKRPEFSSKADWGYVCLIGGCRRYSGAAKLAALSCAASRSGAGVVQLAVPHCITDAVMPFILETTLYPLKDNGDSVVFDENQINEIASRFRTIALGMGMGNSSETQKIVSYILENAKGTVIIDADGLNAVAAIGADVLDKSQASVVITPHTREFSRLTGLSDEQILSNPVQYASDFARKHKAVVLLKGPSTVVTDGKIVYLCDRGCSGMATGGSGDVLSGILAAMLSSSQADTCLTVAAAAFVNGVSGERAQKKNGVVGMVASDTVSEIAQVIKDLTGF